jgi:hypothetical protein
MSGTITVKWENGEGEEVELTFPAKMEVCNECGGEGYVLRGGLRGEAFTQSEFYEAFEDPEDREEYFKPGGRYDEVCDTCHGNNVVPVVDEEQVSRSSKHMQRLYEEYCQWSERRAELEADFAAEREAERRMGC